MTGVKKTRRPGISGPVLAVAYAAAIIVPTAAAVVAESVAPAEAAVVAAGVAALAMLLAQFVTSGRFEQVSGRLGLDVTMGFHRLAGMAVLALVALHIAAIPFQHTIPEISRYPDRIVHALTAPGNTAGVVAAGMLLVLLPWAKWLRGRILPYGIWRMAHGLGATATVLLVGMHALHKGESLFTPVAIASIGILSIVGIGSLAVVYAIRPITAYGRGFRVDSVRRLSPSLVELTATTERPGFSFRPGQFVWIAFGVRHTLTDNPFSIASAPEELPKLRFLIREAGDCTRRVIDLAPGTAVAIDGPHGSFVEHGDPAAIVLIAGGIGIAPILAILRSAAARGDRRPYRLVHAVRRPEDLAASAELQDLALRLDLRVETLVEDGDVPAAARRGRITVEATRTFVEDLDCARVLAFVCGPPGMMDEAAAMLVDCGFGTDRIVMERFDYDAADDPVSRIVRNRFLALLAAIAVALAATIAASG